MIFKKEHSVDYIKKRFLEETTNLLNMLNNREIVEKEELEIVEKSNKLKSIGFTNSKNVIDSKKYDEQLKRNKDKIDLIYVMDYFTLKYPLYKFLTKESIDNLCLELDLKFDEISEYKGSVSDELINLISDFKIDKEDFVYLRRWLNFRSIDIELLSYVNYDTMRTHYNIDNNSSENFGSSSCTYHIKQKMIVAPKKCFKNNINYTDGILIQPVSHKNTIYYLLISEL